MEAVSHKGKRNAKSKRHNIKREEMILKIKENQSDILKKREKVGWKRGWCKTERVRLKMLRRRVGEMEYILKSVKKNSYIKKSIILEI